MLLKSIRGVKDLRGKRVLVRVDYNVPIDNGKIKEDYKIAESLATLRYLRRHGARLILLTHLGKPKTEADWPKYSVEPIAKRLSKMLDCKVAVSAEVSGLKSASAVAKLGDGDVLMLANVRYEAGEEKNDARFAKRLAELAEIYVNDAFAVCHRAHASVSAISKYLPAYAGFLLEDEIKALTRALEPVQPMISIIGGAKISSKTGLVKVLAKKSHKVIIGGALANNFLLARGYETGLSLVDEESIAFARSLKAKNILLPEDAVVKSYVDGDAVRVKNISDIGKKDTILDIGPKTIALYASYIREAATIVWNGPMGRFEEKPFRAGTIALAQFAGARARGRAFAVAGGGETVEAIKLAKADHDFDWISTGGGAMLSFLGGERMPGLEPLKA